jgi:hypothetical protein
MASMCLAISAAADENRWVHPLCRPLPTDRNGPFVAMEDGSLMTVDSRGLRTSRDDGTTWSAPQPVCAGILISFVGLLVGAAVLFGIISGPLAVLASPFLAIFGWFYILPILLAVSLIWAIYQPRRKWAIPPWLLVAISALGGSLP